MKDKKILMKKKCKACGNRVIVKREEFGPTPAPENCATCRTLGVDKAIEQRLMSRRKSQNSIFNIEDGKSFIRHKKDKKLTQFLKSRENKIRQEVSGHEEDLILNDGE